jgi:hypothetical protein
LVKREKGWNIDVDALVARASDEVFGVLSKRLEVDHVWECTSTALKNAVAAEVKWRGGAWIKGLPEHRRRCPSHTLEQNPPERFLRQGDHRNRLIEP